MKRQKKWWRYCDDLGQVLMMKSAGLSIKCHIWTGRYYFLSNYLLYVRPTPKNTQRKSLCSYGTVFSFNVLCWIFIKKRCRKKNIKKTPANIAQRRGENGLRIRKSVLAAFGFLDRILASFGLRSFSFSLIDEINTLMMTWWRQSSRQLHYIKTDRSTSMSRNFLASSLRS